MANRVFQSVIYQMKDAIDRVVGVVDETGAVISCSELNLIGEVREGFMAERLTAGDRFVRDGYTYQQFSSAKHNNCGSDRKPDRSENLCEGSEGDGFPASDFPVHLYRIRSSEG